MNFIQRAIQHNTHSGRDIGSVGDNDGITPLTLTFYSPHTMIDYKGFHTRHSSADKNNAIIIFIYLRTYNLCEHMRSSSRLTLGSDAHIPLLRSLHISGMVLASL